MANDQRETVIRLLHDERVRSDDIQPGNKAMTVDSSMVQLMGRMLRLLSSAFAPILMSVGCQNSR